MNVDNFKLVGKNYSRESELPRDNDIFYKYIQCGTGIPSVPDDNVGCECGKIFIDIDCHRLIVDDMSKLEVVQKWF